MKVGCPTCGAEVEFRYDDSFVRVCGHCRSAVVRGDRGVETLGKFADLVAVPSALRLFAEGRYGTTGFLVIGMAQLRHAAGGVWQEWYAKLDTGHWAWISEAQGRMYLTFERPDVQMPPYAQLAPGAQVSLAGAPYTVGEHGSATYVSALGEIPYRLVPGSAYHFVDLSDGRGGFATLDYNDGSEPPALYLGYQVTPESLGIFGGETAPQIAAPAKGARLLCPSCNGPLELRTPDQSLRVACPYCSTLVSVESGALSIIARQAKKPKPVIPLGQTGKFPDGELTVIGYVARSAMVDGTWWPFEEYLLHAPAVGFRWLVCSDGHWSYVQPVAVGAVSLGYDVAYDGVKFKRFQVAELRVDAVLGEFYWRVEAGERVRAEDYIAPPAMLSREVNKTEQNWSLSTYLTPGELAACFDKKLAARLPAPTGVAPNQPYPTGVGRVMAVAVVAFLALGIGKCASARGTEKLAEQFTIPATSARIAPTTDRPGGVPRYGPLTPVSPEPATDGSAGEATGSVMFSPKFTLEGGRNVAFELTTGLSNNWLYAVIDLVNDETGNVVSFEKSLEYYSGSDSDGSWSEGGNHDTEVLGPVEAGSYVIRVEAMHGGTANVELAVKVRQGVFRWMWFWIGLGVLVIPFGISLSAARAFNRRRWQNASVEAPWGLGTSSGDDDDD